VFAEARRDLRRELLAGQMAAVVQHVVDALDDGLHLPERDAERL